MTTPRRRWSFSLRTLFVVVTVLACWLGYHLNWIRQRHAVLDRFNLIDGNGLRIECSDFSEMKSLFPSLARTAPLSLRILGEPGIGAVTIEAPPAIADAEEPRIRKLFPESRVHVTYTKAARMEDSPATQVDRP